MQIVSETRHCEPVLYHSHEIHYEYDGGATPFQI